MKRELPELEKLRACEARLEAEIAEEKRDLARTMKNLNRLVLMLSDCKKMIGELTLVKMHKV